MPSNEMQFILIHGSYHGAWCWEPVADELSARGFASIAMDLPIDDPHAGLSAYRDAVLAVLPASKRLVVVGHSLGGLVVPLVAASQPVVAMGFVCALFPTPGLSFAQVRRTQPVNVPGGSKPAVDRLGLLHIAPDQAIRRFYSDCDQTAARAAAARLRPQGWHAYEEICSLADWPGVPSAALIGRRDLVINHRWASERAEALGVRQIKLEVGHFPLLSAPRRVAQFLSSIAHAVN